MTDNSLRPITFRVTILADGLADAAPADGFIDPVKVEEYMADVFLTGEDAATVNDGDTIFINDVGVTFQDASDIDDIVDIINSLTHAHHVVAEADDDKLVLKNEALYEGRIISVTGDAEVVDALGYTEPVASTPPTAPATLASSIAKLRANMRWRQVIDNIKLHAIPKFVGAVVMEAADIDTEATTITFTVSYSMIDHVWAEDENNIGEILYGTAAVKRLVARALTQNKTEIQVYLDPTSFAGSNVTIPMRRQAGIRVTAEALAEDLATAEANITVTTIPSEG